ARGCERIPGPSRVAEAPAAAGCIGRPATGGDSFTTSGGRGSAARGGLLGRLDVDRDRHLVADGDAARLEDLVPGDAVVLAIDLGGGLRAGAHLALRVLDFGRGTLDVEAHLARDAVQGQVAGHLEVTRVHLLDLLRHEADSRVLGDVEEIRALQMRIALLDAGVDTGG